MLNKVDMINIYFQNYNYNILVYVRGIKIEINIHDFIKKYLT